MIGPNRTSGHVLKHRRVQRYSKMQGGCMLPPHILEGLLEASEHTSSFQKKTGSMSLRLGTNLLRCTSGFSKKQKYVSKASGRPSETQPHAASLHLQKSSECNQKVLPVMTRRSGGTLHCRLRACSKSNLWVLNPWIKGTHLQSIKGSIHGPFSARFIFTITLEGVLGCKTFPIALCPQCKKFFG